MAVRGREGREPGPDAISFDNGRQSQNYRMRMSRGFWHFLTLVGTVGLIGYLGWEGWKRVGPRRPELNAVRRQLADAVIPEVVEAVREARAGVRSAVSLHLVNDPTDYLTDGLRRELELTGILHLNDLTLGEKLRRALSLPVRTTAQLPEALDEARSRGAQAVLFGAVQTFESVGSGGVLDLELTLAELGRGTVLFHRRFVRDTSKDVPGLAAIEDGVARVGGPQRLVAWVAAVLLLPVFTVGFIRTMVRRGSNRANGMTLGLYTLIDLLLAYVLVGASFASWTAAILFLLLGAAAFAYNVLIMSHVLRLET